MLGLAVLPLLGLAVLLLLGLAACHGWTLYSEDRAGQTALADAAKLSSGLSLDNAPTRLVAVKADLVRARREFQWAADAYRRDPLLRLAASMPWSGDQVRAAVGLTHLGADVSAFGLDAVAVAQDGVTATGQRSDRAVGERVVEFVQVHAAAFDQLGSKLVTLKRDRAAIPTTHLVAPLDRAVHQLDGQLTKLDEDWQQVATSLAAARFLLGIDQPRTFLVIDLDSAELRSAGGFIGSFGFLHVDRGKLGTLAFRDVYTLHEPQLKPGDPGYVEPPQPIAQHLVGGSLTFRDAAWWPDFPTSAAMAERLLKRDEGTTVDGVIGIDPYFLADLLRLVGPVPVPFVHDTFDAQNFYIKSIYHAGLIAPDPPHGRKDFLAYIGAGVQSRLLSLSPSRVSSVADTIRRACLRRDLQVTFHDVNVENLASLLPCTGAIVQTSGDFLLVASAISLAKNNAWVSRSFSLSMAPATSGFVRHRLTMNVVNQAPRKPSDGAYIAPYYEDYLRVLIPAGSRLVALEGQPLKELAVKPESDGGYAEIAGLFRTIRNRYTLTIVYDVPTSRMGSLVWERQAGSGDDPVSAHLTSGNGSAWSSALDHDLRISLRSLVPAIGRRR